MMALNVGTLLIYGLKWHRHELSSRFPNWKTDLRRPLVLFFCSATMIGLLGLSAFYVERFYMILKNSGGDYFIHVVTQGRVFWEYLRRILIPTDLASDHFQPWSTFHDTEAVLKLVGFALLVAGACWFALSKVSRSHKGFSLLLVFALLPFAMRLLYMNIEIMVEYRVYNALPYISLMAGCGLVTVASKIPLLRLRWLPATAIVIIFTILSVERGKVWSSSDSLARNVADQYPLNPRPLTQEQFYDYQAGRYGEVVEGYSQILANFDQIMAANAAMGGETRFDTQRASTSVMRSYHFSIFAQAKLKGYIEALSYARSSIPLLERKLPPVFIRDYGKALTAPLPLLQDYAAKEEAAAMQTPSETVEAEK